jgi:aspartyl-tRNA(Asn)/glutamyl-tRNA(Gln) amidotransferase subunit C
VLDTKDKLRSDIIFDGQSKDEFLANAPESDENFIIVPKIIGE